MLLRFTERLYLLALIFWGLILGCFNDLVYRRYFKQAPTFTIVSNAGFDGALVLGKLLEQDDLKMGYDAAKGLFYSSFLFSFISKLMFLLTL